VGDDAMPKGASPLPVMESSANWPGTNRKLLAASVSVMVRSKDFMLRSSVSMTIFSTRAGIGMYGFFILTILVHVTISCKKRKHF